MVVDLYTKSVLTVIAGSLAWLCFTQGTRPATAQTQTGGLQRVVIAGFATASGIAPMIPVAISDVRTGNVLPVSIMGLGGAAQPLPVSIQAIEARSGSVPVTISEIDSQDGTMPVTIQNVRTDNGALLVTELAAAPPTSTPPR
ncbi:MAG: hypothetical protein AB1689_17690 [Thermodesulfobacteriota bacterium]